MRKALIITALFFVLHGGGFEGLAAAEAKALPTVDDVIASVISRAEKVASEKPEKQFVYTRLLVLEELDSKGEVKTAKKKTYEVTLVNGRLHSKLLQIDGKAVSARELKQEEDEVNERREAAEDKPARGKRRKGFSLTSELADHYQFTIVQRELLNGRSVLLIDFKPRPGLSANGKMMERILSRISGTLWVDEEDYEIAKAELSLSERVTILGGIIGSLDNFKFTLTRKRADEGVWYNLNSAATIEARQFFSSMKVRTREESSDFHPVAKPD